MLFCWDFKTIQYFAAVLPLLLAFPLSAADSRDQTPPFNSPLSAEESLEHFQLHPDLKIELVAAEPQVVDPVAIRFDETGRLWVVEMIDYPNGPDPTQPGQPPMSRIRLLRDENNDGRYETSAVFADNLLFVTGLQPWRGGVIVTLAGKVAYLKDTNGDGVVGSADVHETWFTGFAEKNPQLRANHPAFALDNRIYIANGLRGGDVIARRDQWSRNMGGVAEAISISGMDFRFDPRSGQYEAVTGNGQFGLTFDDFGNRFVCSNRNPCKHVVLEDRYIRRNPHLAVRETTHDVSPAGEDSRVFPISRTWTTSTLHQGQFTAACGVTIYRGDALPPEFRGNSFTCEPTGNLVHRDVISPEGATFTSRPGREGVEFLATRDEWFRPVNLAGGPDGALYVVDMYRAVIEHPQWVPDELKNRPDERYGDDRGRIYRIVPRKPSQTGERRRSPGFPESRGSFTAAELVALLNHSNGWHRETAARLIYERQDASLRPHLESLARTASTPQGRIHALWALRGLKRLSADQIQTALADEHPRVTEQAVRLAEPFLAENQSLREKLRQLAAHPDPRLRFQVALSLGEIGDTTDAQTVAALADIALQSPGDPWTRNAVLSSLSDKPLPLLEIIMEETGSEAKPPAPGIPDLIEATAEVIGSRRNETELKAALKTLCPPEITATPGLRARMAGLDGLGSGLARRGQSLRAVIARLPDDDRKAVEAVFQAAIEIAESSDAENAQRIQALQTLKHAEYSLAGQPLLQLAADGTNRAVQIAAIETLSAFDAEKIGPALLADFAAQTPAVRRAVLDALLADESRTRLLLEEIAVGKIAASELDPGRTARLGRHRNPEIRQRAKKLLAAVPEDRKQVLEKYQPALALKADPAQGRPVFEKHCAACHRIGTLGVNVAPDIADSRNKTPSYLLTAILDPNRAVDSNYFSYTVVTTQGKVHTGVISAETATSVTLRQQENKTVTLLREDIDEIRSTGVSLMPVGLEKNIPAQQMADLISFIKNWRYLDGRIPIEVGPE